MDFEVGRLIERMGELGLTENTIVVLIADHGEEFIEHGHTFHGHSVYGELTNVPLMFWSPGLLAGSGEVEETVRSIDLLPTLMDLCGLEAPWEVQGQSLRPLLEGAQGGDGGGRVRGVWAPMAAVSEKAPSEGMFSPNGSWESFAIVRDGWKLIRNEYRVEGQPEFELFDHKADRLNLKNVADENPEVVAELAAAIDEWHEEVNAEKLATDAEFAASASAEDLERLRSLGYLR